MRQTLPIVILGTSLWFVALVVEIATSAPKSAIWICLVGIALGLMGSAYIVRGLAKSRRAQRQ